MSPLTKEFKEHILAVLIHKEKMNALSKTKAYIDELSDLEMAMYEQFQRFQKASILVKSVVDGTEITKELVESAFNPQERYALLQAAKNAVAFEKNNPKAVDKQLDSFNEKPPKYNAKGLSNTYQITLDLAKNGKKPSEIAAERSMTLDTIYRHLTKFVQKGFIDVAEIIDPDRILTILKAINSFEEDSGATPIKELLGDDFSYGEIRLVRAALPYLE